MTSKTNDAYDDGVDAYRRGRPLTANPHGIAHRTGKVDAEANRRWRDGWLDAATNKRDEVTRDDVERALDEHRGALSPQRERVIRMLYGLPPYVREFSSEEISLQDSVARARTKRRRDLALMQLKLIPEEEEEK